MKQSRKGRERVEAVLIKLGKIERWVMTQGKGRRAIYTKAHGEEYRGNRVPKINEETVLFS